MTPSELKQYKDKLSVLNKDYDNNMSYYLGKNIKIMKDVNTDKHGMIKAQDRRIPLPIARKLINTLVGFQFSDIKYKETGRSLTNQITFTNLMTEANREIDVTSETEYFKYFKTVNAFNDNDILDLQTAIGACNNGRAYKIYYFADGMLKCDIVPTNQICPVYSDTLNPVMEKAIKYYQEKTIDADGKETVTYYADVYTPTGIEYYKAKNIDYSDAVVDPSKPPVIYSAKKIPEKIHVVEYSIFRDKSPLVAHTYGMIDEADRIMSKNIAEELAAFKAVILKTSFIPDDKYRDPETGKTAFDRFQETNILPNISKDDIAEWMIKEIPGDFTFGAYDRLIKHIFQFVDIPNFSDAESWGNAISGVSAGYRLLGFLFLCNQTFRIWQEGKRQEIDLINAYVDLLSGNEEVKRSMNELEIISNRILPKNVLENAQIAGMLKDIVPDDDLIKMFPEIVSDVDGAIKRIEEQREKANERLMGGANETPDETKTSIDEMTTPLPENATGKSFNGAQVQAINDIVASVASGEISRDSGINQLIILFGVTPEQAERIIGESGTKTGAVKQGAVVKAIEGKPKTTINGDIK